MSNNFLIWEKASRDTIDVKRVHIDVAGNLVTQRGIRGTIPGGGKLHGENDRVKRTYTRID